MRPQAKVVIKPVVKYKVPVGTLRRHMNLVCHYNAEMYARKGKHPDLCSVVGKANSRGMTPGICLKYDNGG